MLEPALLSVCKEATVGKILIQTNEATDEPAVREHREKEGGRREGGREGEREGGREGRREGGN